MSKGYVRVTNARVSMSEDTAPEDDEAIVWVDRTNPVLGNEFVLRNKLDRKERDHVLALYSSKLDADLSSGGPMSKAIRGLADRVLAGEKICLQCWCRPLPCHADRLEKEVYRIVLGEQQKQSGDETPRPRRPSC